MHKLALAAGIGLAAPLARGGPAQASIMADGITYDLEETTTANPLVNLFALVITGENTASDTEGGVNAGRTGINAIAFNQPSGFVAATMLIPLTGYSFNLEGLSSSGCHGGGNFFCFDNTAIPPIPTTDVTGKLVFVFSEQVASAADFNNYTPDLKIDWVGTANNYDLVSKTITPDATCSDCTPTQQQVPVSEPGTLFLFGSGIAALAIFSLRRRQLARSTLA